MSCNHPFEERKRKVYYCDGGQVREILCKKCWASLNITMEGRSLEGFKRSTVKRYLNAVRELRKRGELQNRTTYERGDGVILELQADHLIQKIAREMKGDWETAWKLSLVFANQNLDGEVEPRVSMGPEGRHYEIAVKPAPRECEPWPYKIASLSIEEIRTPIVAGKDFTIGVSLDYCFDEPTEVFVGVRQNSGQWLSSTYLILSGFSSTYLTLSVKSSPIGLQDLIVKCYHWNQNMWSPLDSETFNVRVEEIRTSGLGATAGGIAGGLTGLLPLLNEKTAPLALVTAPLGVLAGTFLGDRMEYEAMKSERERQIEQEATKPLLF